ncbi:NADH:ubiquinone oxidoreductase complex I intermediate-associated protein 30 [Ectothiorhodospira sp. PHS-1]|uniref:CIA30 family protein n=1 Tax=Ectothiorhodospira sp. PHS-1 TaxID=519989 RepID=UPI00024A87DC|nr:CIA30 family protein [Ectothiorhodospira sp. PHS-1]EHQ53560.1 NADH:ubiquinone oxidoreductase complex I intermediate-associated protein 30 [Ectothiorhodospira sp. PHS-1]
MDFSDPSVSQAWHAIDDRVMGGMSQSCLRHDPAGFAVFEGVMSLDQGGGFASVRTDLLRDAESESWRLPEECDALVLEACGDGKAYKLSLRMDRRFDGISYQATFQPPAGIWSRIRLSIQDFVAAYHGKPVPGAPPLVLDRVCQIGFVIARQAHPQDGPFRLAIRSIRAD